MVTLEALSMVGSKEKDLLLTTECVTIVIGAINWWARRHSIVGNLDSGSQEPLYVNVRVCLSTRFSSTNRICS